MSNRISAVKSRQGSGQQQRQNSDEVDEFGFSEHQGAAYGSLRSDTPSYLSYQEVRSHQPTSFIKPARNFQSSLAQQVQHSDASSPQIEMTTLERPYSSSPLQEDKTQNDVELARQLWQQEQQHSQLRQRSPTRQTQHLPPTPPRSETSASNPTRLSRREQQISNTLSDPRVREQLMEREAKKYRPWFIYIVSFAQIVVLLASFGVNLQLTGSVIATNPINIMIGPSALTLIRLGARFVPCIRSQSSLNSGQMIQCPGQFSSSNNGQCTLADVCGLLSDQAPNQWWRFIVPIFLHGGLLHIGLNLWFQLSTGAQLERDFGWFRIAPIYFLSGIFGFVFGGTFANELNPSVGCSGALFGLVAVMLIDLFLNWRIVLHPWKETAKLVVLILISFAFGLIPGVDNFSHIGGFFIGLLSSVAILPQITWKFSDPNQEGVSSILKLWNSYSQEIRKLFLIAVSVGLVILFYALIFSAFYSGRDSKELCPGCQYFGCLPIGGLCDIGAQTQQ